MFKKKCLILTIFTLKYSELFDLKSSYIGCYKFILPTRHSIVDSVSTCQKHCREERNNLLALKNGSQCYCTTRLDSAVSSSHCNVSCSAGDDCGGREVFSVYKGKPRVMHDDLFASNLNWTKQFILRSNVSHTLEACAHFCIEINITHFTNMIDGECNCLHDYDDFTPSRSQLICDHYCPEDRNEICGCRYAGDVDNNNILYGTRFQYDFQRGTSAYSHCSHDGSVAERTKLNTTANIYEIKSCKVCDEGWKGDSCRERDCTTNNGGCGSEMKCVVSTVNEFQYTECVCPHGTVRNRRYLCEVFRHNLAAGKKFYLSSVSNKFGFEAKYLNDGGYRSAEVDDESSTWMAVDLLYFYCVGFVRAHERISLDKKMFNRANKLAVKLNESFNVETKVDARNALKLCGYGPDQQAIRGSQPLIVICNNFTLLSRFVIIEPSDTASSKMALEGFEVYEVGCDLLNGRCGQERKCTEMKTGRTTVVSCTEWDKLQIIHLTFHRCFRKVTMEHELYEIGLSEEQCQERCQRSFNFAVLHAGFKCFCANHLTVSGEMPVDYCAIGHYQSYLIYDTSISHREDHNNLSTTWRRASDEIPATKSKNLQTIGASTPTTTDFDEIIDGDEDNFTRKPIFVSFSNKMYTFAAIHSAIMIVLSFLAFIFFARTSQKERGSVEEDSVEEMPDDEGSSSQDKYIKTVGSTGSED
ncbi:hypothetical protein HELRODRAFT_176275 [Helobdella robusta]|uniref:WSC domain-containing protein n=1 Tax=Helobdella robusta TaxID=6412 RepID=T1FAC8_HELRO|nr:hypothetical protein HELRODRAFT_176275 [Helobdella robusta]ESN99974.1 hypothetical protein HELRODRAFT_176275 [Helobdella robusta]